MVFSIEMALSNLEKSAELITKNRQGVLLPDPYVSLRYFHSDHFVVSGGLPDYFSKEYECSIEMNITFDRSIWGMFSLYLSDVEDPEKAKERFVLLHIDGRLNQIFSRNINVLPNSDNLSLNQAEEFLSNMLHLFKIQPEKLQSLLTSSLGETNASYLNDLYSKDPMYKKRIPLRII